MHAHPKRLPVTLSRAALIGAAITDMGFSQRTIRIAALVFALAGTGGIASAATTSPTCPSGYSFSRVDRACVMAQAPTCDYGYAWNAQQKKCLSSAHPRQDCPSGYQLVSQGTACAPRQQQPPHGAPTMPPQSTATIPPTCPSGFVWSASAHQCQSTTSPPPNCPSGYTYKASRGQCVTTVQATCPAGYQLDIVHGVCSTGPVAQ
jgi:hypothetical protein